MIIFHPFSKKSGYRIKIIFCSPVIIFSLITIISTIPTAVFSQKLEFKEAYKQGESFGGLTNPTEIAIDIFGKNVYVASSQQNTLAVFSRDATTGDLTFQQILKDDSNGVDGLKSARSIIFSPNRKQVYVAGTSDAAISVFTRDQTTGLLTFLEIKKDVTGDVGDLGRPNELTITSDGLYLYAATTDGIVAFSRDQTTGALTYIDIFTRGADDINFSPSNITISLEDNYIYASNHGDSSVTVFTRNSSNGNLTLLETYKNGSFGISNMTLPSKMIIPSDDNMYVVSSRDSSILFFQRDVTTGLINFNNYYKQGQNGVDGLITINSMSISYDLNNLYTTSAKDSSVSVFKIDATTGELTYSSTLRQGQNGVDGIRGCRFAIPGPNGKQLYAAGFNGNTVALFNRDQTTGVLTYTKQITNGVIGNDGIQAPTFIATDDTGKNIYILSASKNTLAVYSRDANTGEITFQQIFKDGVNGIDGLKGAKYIAIGPGRRNVYVAGSSDFAIACFTRNTSTGLLTFLEVKKDITDDVGDLGLPNSIGITGNYFYTSTSDGLVVFTRNGATGKLTYLNIFNRGVSDISFAPNSLKISPDLQYIYLTNALDSSLNVFSLNSTTGVPTFVNTYKNGKLGISGMTQPANILIDPDGNNVYVSSNRDSTIIAFSRDQTTGLLSFLEKYKQGVNETDGLTLINSMNFDWSGTSLFTSNSKDSSVSILNRDASTGKLTYAGTYKQSQDGIDGIKGCAYAIPSGDGYNLYAAGNTNSAIALFNITVIPLAPKNIQASSTTTAITLTWDANSESNISTYEIFRSTSSDYKTATSIGSENSSVLTYSDNTVSASTTYYYWVKATDSDGNSSWFSKFVSASLSTSTPTSIKQNSNTKISSIYPNPTSDKVTIELMENITATIEVTNAEGQLVKSISTPNKATTLDVSEMSSGIYYIKIISDQNTEINKLIIK